MIEDIKRDLDTIPGIKGSMAKWGALGAVLAIPLPLVGPIIGGLAGAAYGYHRRKSRG